MPTTDDTARRLLERVLLYFPCVRAAAQVTATRATCLDTLRITHSLEKEIRAYLAPQPKDEEPPSPPLIQHAWNHDCAGHSAGFGEMLCTVRVQRSTRLGWCAELFSRHVRPTEDPPPVVHPSKSIPKR